MGYQDDSLSISERVEDLLAQMTLEEKTAQLCCCTLPDSIDDATIEKLFAHGMGTMNYLNSSLTGDHQKDIDTLQRIQDYLIQNTRLGIPVLAHSEAIAGAQIPGADPRRNHIPSVPWHGRHMAARVGGADGIRREGTAAQSRNLCRSLSAV